MRTPHMYTTLLALPLCSPKPLSRHIQHTCCDVAALTSCLASCDAHRLAEAAVAALGETFAKPEAGEPRCASEHHSTFVNETYAMREVGTHMPRLPPTLHHLLCSAA